MGIVTKIFAIIAITCFVLPITYLGVDAIGVNGNLFDLPGGLYTFSALGPAGLDDDTGVDQGSQTMDIVDRTIKISYTDGMSQGVLASRTGSVYNLDGSLYEALSATDSAGQVTSTKTYRSGTSYYFHETTTNQAIYFTVPRMMRSTWQGTTAANPIPITGFTVNTYTDLFALGATTLADAYEFNYTLLGTTGTLSYSLQAVTDDRGFVSSDRNPDSKLNGAFYGQAAYLFIVMSGGDYDKALITGFNSYDTGATVVYYKHITDAELSKDKDGNTYKPGMDGATSISIPYDFSSMSSATNTTMQLYLMLNSDPFYAAWYRASGATDSAYGTHTSEVAETTIELGA